MHAHTATDTPTVDELLARTLAAARVDSGIACEEGDCFCCERAAERMDAQA